jgi:hypothetical protein
MTTKEESPQPPLQGESIPLLLKEGLGVVDTSFLFFVVARFIGGEPLLVIKKLLSAKEIF